MGDIMAKKRKSVFYRIQNWIDKKILNNYASIKCEFCGKKMIVTATEFYAVGGRGCCSYFCAKQIMR